MAPRLKKVLRGFKKGIPEGKLKSLPPVPGTQNVQGLANNALNQANKGLQSTPVRKAVPKSVAVLKAFGGTFKRQYSRLLRVVN